MLDAMMSGRKPPKSQVLLPPVGVVARQSTDTWAVENPHVAEALRLIRTHACDPIDVGDVLQHVPVSRRWLEQKFQKHIQRTPHAEIRRRQLARARALLAETDEPISVVATTCGFRDANFFTRVFSKHEGTPPATYRRQYRLS